MIGPRPDSADEAVSRWLNNSVSVEEEGQRTVNLCLLQELLELRAKPLALTVRWDLQNLK